MGKMMDNIKAGIEPMQAIEKASGQYGRFNISVADLYYIEFSENMQAYSSVFDTFPAFDGILRVLLLYAIIV